MTRSFLSSLLLGALMSVPAGGAVFVVDRMDIDREDLHPGDGKCEWFPLGDARCPLRAAVQEANALPGGDVIVIPAAWHVVLTRAGAGEDDAATGDLDILESVTIGSIAAPGFWPVIDGGGLDRVFEVWAGQLTLVGVEVTGGSTAGVGGAVRVQPDNTVSVTHCRLAGNTASSAGGALYLESTGTIFPPANTVTDCTIEDNQSPEGAAIFAAARLEVTGSTLRDNRSGSGAGVGSAVLVRHFDPVAFRNATIAYNHGAGLRMEDGQGLILSNVTVTQNGRAGVESECISACGDLTVMNSILAFNGGADCDLAPGGSDTVDVNGNHNLDTDNSCGLSTAFGDLQFTDPQLGPLQRNGGTTETFVPLPTSPVIEAGDNGSCESTDQRGVARPLDSDDNTFYVCEMGAVEVLPCDVAPETVSLSGGNLGNGTTVACFQIVAGNLEVLPGAVHTFRTRGSVVLGDGFTVRENVSFSVVRDPGAGSSVSLP